MQLFPLHLWRGAYSLTLTWAGIVLNEPHGFGPEALLVANELGDFNYLTTYQWSILQAYFSSGIRFREMLSIGKILQQTLNLPKLNRANYRSYPALIKWFCQNWTAIAPILPYIKLVDDDYHPISAISELKTSNFIK